MLYECICTYEYICIHPLIIAYMHRSIYKQCIITYDILNKLAIYRYIAACMLRKCVSACSSSSSDFRCIGSCVAAAASSNMKYISITLHETLCLLYLFRNSCLYTPEPHKERGPTRVSAALAIRV